MSTANPNPAAFESPAAAGIAGFNFAESWQSLDPAPSPEVPNEENVNPLKDYFESHTSGHGIWKWNHYFDIYHRYFRKFVGKKTSILEIGIYSGGSLDMWRHYFGAGCEVYGIDVREACRVYEGDGKRIFIGDQANREFWRQFREQVPSLDIVIDEAGIVRNNRSSLWRKRCLIFAPVASTCVRTFIGFITIFRLILAASLITLTRPRSKSRRRS